MSTYLLIYEPPASFSQRALLQHQAILATARAVLVDPVSEEPTWSGNRLLAPAHPEVVPLLAMVARDFAPFVEPESRGAHPAPIALYDDAGTRLGSGETEDAVLRLLHPSWFERLGRGLAASVEALEPVACVVAGEPRHAMERLDGSDARFERRLYFEVLLEANRRNESPGNWIAADRSLRLAIEREAGRVERTDPAWNRLSRFAESDQEEWELEPFTAFGPALELALWGEGSN